MTDDLFLMNHHLLTNKEVVYSWLKKVERKYGVDPEIGSRAWCEKGLYQTVAWDNLGCIIKQEGSPAASFSSPEMAWKMWAGAFWLHQIERGGKIYWRHKPELDVAVQKVSGITPQDFHEMTWEIKEYMVYARVFVDYVFVPPGPDGRLRIVDLDRLSEYDNDNT